MEKNDYTTLSNSNMKLDKLLASTTATILQVLPSLETGGVERGTVDIAEAIVNSGGRAIVVSSGGRMVSDIERVGGEHIMLPVNSKNPIRMFINSRAISSLVLEKGVDIIHARSRAPAWSAFLAARQTNRKFVTTFHGTYNENNSLKSYYNSVMARGDTVIAISEFIAGHIRRNYGVPKNILRVIHRGVDLGRFSLTNISENRVEALARKWRLPDGVPVIMLPGRLTRWKGQEVFIHAIKKTGLNNLKCLIVGSEQGRHRYKASLEKLIEQTDLSDVIHLIDHCDDMPAAYMLADIVVSASIEPEAFGRVVVEAQALGRLVVATDHGGTQETIENGSTGWLIKPNDANAMAEILKTLLSCTREEREKISTLAIKNVNNNFSKEAMCEKTIKLYKSMVSN